MTWCCWLAQATRPPRIPTRTTPNPITDAAKASLVKYLASGGRVLGEHFNWAWIRSYPAKSDSQSNLPVPSPLGSDVATWFPYLDTTDASSSAVPAGTTAQALVDTSFPKGRDFAQWLLAAKATQTLDTFPLVGDLKRTAIDELTGLPSAQRWLYQPASPVDPAGAAAYAHYLTFNLTSSGQVVDRNSTDATNLCGRFAYTGLHVDSGDATTHASDLADDKARAAPFPSCCAVGDLEPLREGHGVHGARPVGLPVARRRHDRRPDRFLAQGCPQAGAILDGSPL